MFLASYLLRDLQLILLNYEAFSYSYPGRDNMDFSDLDAVTWPYQLTKAVHRDMYPVLEPSNPDINANGKTVLITGVSGGVGKVRCACLTGVANSLYTVEPRKF